MSLVNDLLIELNQDREGASRSDANPLEGLSPRKPPAVDPQPRLQNVPRALALVALIAAGCLGFGVARLGLPETSDEAPATDNQGASALPRVSAPRPKETVGKISPDVVVERIAGQTAAWNSPPQNTLTDADLRIERPIALRAVRVEQAGVATRVEITTDRGAEYRIEPGPVEGVFSIVLEQATLRERLPMLDLFGTAIRSIETQHEDDAIRLQFTLDADSRVQSQRLDQAEGTVLIVDFQPASQSRVEPIRRASTKKESDRTTKAIDSSDYAAVSKPQTTEAKQTQPRPKPREGNGMTIARSASDRERSSREKVRQTADLSVESAREARKSGDLELAAQLYSTARRTSPGHHEAVLEGASVLSQLGRVDEALALISEARAGQPKNPAYLMVHAKILAETDLQSAITLLDEAGHSIEAAPELQALTAAYLQKNGQHDSAIERYEAILRRYPNRSEVWLGLGISLEARGRNMEAVDVYRIAMQLGELPGPSRGWISARIDALSEES